MNYELLASLLLLIFLLTGETVLFWKLWTRQENQHREERINWERERERLLNRAMTKEWTSYAQMQASQILSFASPSDDPVRGMSDEEELSRIGRDLVEAEGLGETLVELDNDDREFFRQEFTPSSE